MGRHPAPGSTSSSGGTTVIGDRTPVENQKSDPSNKSTASEQTESNKPDSRKDEKTTTDDSPGSEKVDEKKTQHAIVGSLCMNAQIQHFARIPKETKVIGEKMLDIALEMWKLKRPKVLISVTGGPSRFSCWHLEDWRQLTRLLRCACGVARVRGQGRRTTSR